MRLRDAEANAVSELAMLAAAQGRFDELHELTGPGWPDPGGAAGTIRAVRRAWALGLAALGSGRAEDALVLLDVSGRGEPWISPWLTADLVEAAVQAGEPTVAEPALAAFDAWARRAGPPIARALAARGRGLLADGDAAVAELQTAVAYHDLAFQPFERARTELALGGTLRRARRRSEARAPLRAALSVFDQLGATPWADRARSELRASGETFQRRDPAAVETLTPQEFQVARSVAAGGTNRDVAAQLFLSHRTVAYHLHNVYRKLGVTSRTELARVEFEQGLEMSPR
jgi:DNA-binding CsgD family transcriptional regulator